MFVSFCSACWWKTSAEWLKYGHILLVIMFWVKLWEGHMLGYNCHMQTQDVIGRWDSSRYCSLPADVSYSISHLSTSLKTSKFLNESGKDCSYVTWRAQALKVGLNVFTIQDWPHYLNKIICQKNLYQSKSLRTDKLKEIPYTVGSKEASYVPKKALGKYLHRADKESYSVTLATSIHEYWWGCIPNWG